MENKNYIWRPVSEYTGGRVLATNGLDVIIGEINSDGDCESEEDGSTILFGITGFIKIEEMLPELKEDIEDERIRRAIKLMYSFLPNEPTYIGDVPVKDIFAWLEKQGEQKPSDKEPKFKVGDIITPKDRGHEPWQIIQVDILDKKYRFKDGYIINFSQEDNYELVEQNHADWTEDDETMKNQLVDFMLSGIDISKAPHGCIAWLKTIKDKR